MCNFFPAIVFSCGVYAAYGFYRLIYGGPPLPLPVDPEAGLASLEAKIDGSGPEAINKKDGSGSHNWGTLEDEIKAEDDKASISAENMNDSTAENENPEAGSMALDEWKGQQTASRDKPTFLEVKAEESPILDIPVGDLVDLGKQSEKF